MGDTEVTLDARLAAHPEALGKWARLLVGDTKPIFTKLIHTSFPSHVHVGFRRPVERGQFLEWLLREQELLRGLLAVLRVPDEPAMTELQSLYSAWATRQALAGWGIDDDEATASRLGAYVPPAFELGAWLRDVRANRARIVDTLNEIDLKREAGNLFLTAAGIVHAIFGLSHQTHPLDPSRPELEKLFALLEGCALRGDSDDALEKIIAKAGLSELRSRGSAPPKNEAWLPASVEGVDVLAEPQQTSDTTLSFADFYTPFTWGGREPRFRKGSPRGGLSEELLRAYLAEVQFAVSPVDSFRRTPKEVPGAASATRKEGRLFCLLDEPSRWPFFTAYQLELTGSVALVPPPGVFQELVVTRGRVALGDAHGHVGDLSTSDSGFVPATVSGAYTLVAKEPSSVLLFAVPGARGGTPKILGTSAAASEQRR
jgi:hypothetical protein